MKDPVTQATAAGNRSVVRLPVDLEEKGSVEVRVQRRLRCLPLLDIHEDGLCFEWPGGLPEIAAGLSLADALVRVGGRAIRGSMVIRHVTSSISTGTHCGARFRPASVAERSRLKEIVNQVRARSHAASTSSRTTMLHPARSDEDARAVPCPYCLADLEPGESIEGSICPYCLQELGSL